MGYEFQSYRILREEVPVLAYNTSNLYKEAIDKDSRITFIDGELKTANGTVIPIDNKSIDQGTFYITNQCVNNDAFTFGSVFSAEAGITIKTEIDRYSLYGSEIKLFFNILLSNNEYEKIPMGVFYVNEPNRVGKHISIKAYDKMVDLDEDITEALTGKVFDLLTYISVNCDVELAQTEQEILQLVNTDALLSVVPNRVGTYRDLLSYLAQITCTFALFDRTGKLRLCEFGTQPVRSISAKKRSSSKFSDFETYFSSAKADFIFDSVYKTYTHISENCNGLKYDAGEIPIVQGVDETNQLILDNMFVKLENVRYTPCEVTFTGDPSLDLGDVVVNVDRFGNEIESLITYYKWSYRGGHILKSAGQNPKLIKAKEKVSGGKGSAELEAAIAEKEVAVYVFTNGQNISIKGGDLENSVSLKEIVRISVASVKATTCVAIVTIPFEMSHDGEVEFLQFLDGVLLREANIKQYCSKGHNVVTFMNYFDIDEQMTARYSVSALSRFIESDIRVHDAKVKTNENARNATIIGYESIVSKLKSSSSVPITSLSDSIMYDIVEIDRTVPTATIERFSLRAVVIGQGLAGTIPWDGTIMVSEEFDKFNTPSIITSLLPFTSSIETKRDIPVDNTIIAQFGLLTNHHQTTLLDMGIDMGFNQVVANYTMNTDKKETFDYNDEYVSSVQAFSLKTEYTYTSEEKEIDNGVMCSVIIRTDDKLSVEEVSIS